jgi:tetratricopeptide (TPR) repeat protein
LTGVVAVLIGALMAPAVALAAAQGVQRRIDEAASALMAGDAGQSVTSYTEALKDTALANDRRATILNDRAVAYWRLGETKLAVEDFNRAVQLFPEYAATYNNRGNLLLSIGMVKEALKDFDRAILLSPGYAAAYNNRAGALSRLGQRQEALKDYTRAIKLMPGNAVPLNGRGRVYAAIGRPHAAIRDFTRAINADARFAAAYRDRADAKLDIQRVDDAVEDLSRALAFDPNNADILLLRGHAYLGADNVAAAIKDFAQVIEVKPTWAAGYAARGLASGYTEAFDEAFADLNKAVELDAKSAVALAYRAIVYTLAGQAEVAAKDVEAALKLEPDRAEVYWARAELEEARGRGENAITDLRKALELRPGLRQATLSLERLGAKQDGAADRTVAGAGIDKFRVVARGTSYFAVSDDFPRLRVPLEMAGDGEPKLLEWELKKAPLKGIATLRFSGGSVEIKGGSEDVELVAIVDLASNSVVGIEPHRQGSKVATWNWEDGKVTVASTDGVTDEFILRAVKPRDESYPGRRYAGEGRPGWAAWSEGAMPRERPTSRQQYRKPKTLFDLLFN